MTTTMIGRCAAQTFDGIEPRQCTRPASGDRDGLAVCRQHAKLDRVTAWNPSRRLAPVAPLTEAEIVERFSETMRAAMHITAYGMARLDDQAARYPRAILRQNDRDEPIRADFDTYVRGIARTAALALADLGTLTDDEIVMTLRTAAAAA